MNIKYLSVLLISCLTALFSSDSLKAKLENSDKQLKISILLEMAAKEAESSSQSARAYAQNALDLAKESGNSLQQLRALGLITEISYYLLDLEATAQAGYAGAMLSYEIKHPEKVGFFYNLIGAAYDDKEDYENSLRNYFLALSANKEVKDLKGQARNLHNIALAYRQTGKYDLALKYFWQAITIKEQLKEFRSAANSYNSLGNVYCQARIYDKSQQVYNKALTIFTQEKDSAGIADVLGNLGMLFMATDSLNAAEKVFNQALKIDQVQNNLPGIAATANNLGLLYLKRAQYGEAEEAFMISLAAEKKQDRSNGQAEVLNNLAQLKLAQNDKESAEKLILQAVSLSNQADLLTAQQIYSTAGMVYLLKGNYRLGKEMLDKYATLKDSLFNTKMTKEMANARTKYENVEKEKQQFSLIRDKEINRLEKQINRYRLMLWMVVFGGGTVISTVLFFKAWKRRSVQNK